ncbi:CHAT domain-containing protein [Mycena leptocephala]|nr:CHAT domain-containing protein [Mycena leptocephala]
MEGFRRQPKLEESPQLLAVAQPSAVGQAYIPGTREEIDHIQSHASGKLSVLCLEEHNATVETASDPTASALLLAGSERLTLSLPHANLAFLSACQTATGAKKLPEELIHLAAGMLLAGYRGVIATMWTIMDNDAPQVASEVYEHLFKTSPPDPSQAAEALHFAVRKLREESGEKKSFFYWVPYIHVGV